MIKKINGIALTSDIPYEAFNWRNNPAIWKWCRQHTLISREHHRNWLSKSEADPTIKMFGIYAAGKPVGVCGLTSIDQVNQKAEFSLYIAPEHHKQGYGKKALYSLCKHGFEDMNLNRIWGESYEDNPAVKMFVNLGFVQEGVLSQSYFREGKFIDSYIYGVTRDRFKDYHAKRAFNCVG